MNSQRGSMMMYVVIVMDQIVPHGSWITGRVTKTYPDKKVVLCAVQLKTKTTGVAHILMTLAPLTSHQSD